MKRHKQIQAGFFTQQLGTTSATKKRKKKKGEKSNGKKKRIEKEKKRLLKLKKKRKKRERLIPLQLPSLWTKIPSLPTVLSPRSQELWEVEKQKGNISICLPIYKQFQHHRKVLPMAWPFSEPCTQALFTEVPDHTEGSCFRSLHEKQLPSTGLLRTQTLYGRIKRLIGPGQLTLITSSEKQCTLLSHGMASDEQALKGAGEGERGI